MRSSNILIIAVLLMGTTFMGCGGGGEQAEDTSPDTTAVQQDEQHTLQDAADDIQQTHNPISGAQSLINDAHTAADQADERTHELEEAIGDM